MHVFSIVDEAIKQGNSLEDIKASEPGLFGTLKDGMITLPTQSIYVTSTIHSLRLAILTQQVGQLLCRAASLLTTLLRSHTQAASQTLQATTTLRYYHSW